MDFELLFVGESRNAHTDIFRMKMDGGEPVRVAPSSGPRARFAHLAWSPDGSRNAFKRRFSYHSKNLRYSEILVVDADGAGLTELTQTARDMTYNDRPSWSPDGRRIAFSRYVLTPEWSNHPSGDHYEIPNHPSCATSSEVYVMNADGSNVARGAGHQARGGRYRHR